MRRARVIFTWCSSSALFLAAALTATSSISPRLSSAAEARWISDHGYRLPDPHYTPGAVRPLETAVVCTTSWGTDQRHVTLKMKRTVCALYGAENCPSREWEIDHLVSRELGGADSIPNLFPQPIAQARLKDRLENFLHRQVCAGSLALALAQRLIRTNWIAAYRARWALP